MESGTPENAGLYDLLAWLEKNKQRVIIAVVGVIALVMIVTAVFNYQTQKETRASLDLSEIRVPFSPMQATPPGTVNALLAMAKDHSGSRAAARALVLAGGLQYQEGDYAGAQVQFSRLLTEYPDSEWVAQASLGVAASLGSLGKTNEAIAEYEKVRKRFANSEIVDETKLALARLYEAKSPEDAYKLYDDLVKTGGQMSGLGAEAGMRLEDLMKKHPELEKLRQPITPVTMTPPTMSPNTNIQITMSTNRQASAMKDAAMRAFTNRVGSNSAVQIRTLPNSATPTPGAPNAPSLSPAPAPPPAPATPK